MKSILSIILIVFLLTACNKDGVDMKGCGLSKAEFNNKGNIQNVKFKVSIDTWFRWYLIPMDNHPFKDYTKVVPCNLPKSYEVFDSEIELSGKLFEVKEASMGELVLEITKIH